MSWRDLLLGDLLTLQRGFDITKAQQSEGPFPVVSSSGVNSHHSEFKCHGPGVIIGRKGTLGTAFFLEGAYWPHDTSLWVKDFKGNDPSFCYYLLRSMGLEKYDVGSSNPTLNRNHLHLLGIRAPSPGLQRRIAEILSVYDDLIENNTRRIVILEDMARRLFDEWFGNYCMPPASAHRAELPDGWTAATLSDWVTDLRDAVDPNSLDPATAYVGLEHLPRRSTTLSEWGAAGDVGSTKLKYQPGDILFSKIRPYFHKVAVMPTEGVCSSDAIVMRPKSYDYLPMAIGLTSSDAFVAHATQTSNGTKMPRADWKVLKEYPLPLPDAETLGKFNTLTGPWLEMAASLAASSTNLRTTRDLLLPKLISGEIEVRAAEEELEAAAA